MVNPFWVWKLNSGWLLSIEEQGKASRLEGIVLYTSMLSQKSLQYFFLTETPFLVL